MILYKGVNSTLSHRLGKIRIVILYSFDTLHMVESSVVQIRFPSMVIPESFANNKAKQYREKS